MKNNKKKLSKKDIKDAFSLEKIAFRLISSILLFNLTNIMHNGLIDTLAYGQDYSIIAIAIVLLFAIVSLSLINILIKDSDTDLYICILSLVLCSKHWLNKDNTSAALIVILFLIFIFLFQFKKSKTNYNKEIKLLIPIIALVSVIQLYFIGKYGVLKYKTFASPNFDLGIPIQNFYYMAKTWIPYSTCERDILLSHFAVHLSFVYYLVMPIYKVFTSEYTLPIVSSIIVISGVIPTYLITTNHKLKDKTKLLISLIYLIYAPMICGTYFDFHENLFLLPLLLWLFYFYEKENKLGFIISLILVLFVKEDASIYTTIFGIYMYFDGHKKEGIITSIASIIYFMLGVFILNKYGVGVMADRYNNLIYENAGMLGIIKTFIVNPSYFINQLTIGNHKLRYYIQLLLPLGFIPLISKEKKNYILLIPVLLTTMTTYQYSFDITFHYGYGVMAFLIYLFILNVKNIKIEDYLIICFVGALLVNMAYVVPHMERSFKNYNENKSYYTKKEKFLKKIPQDASVSASTFLVPHLANRDFIYETYYHKNKLDVEYVVIDTGGEENDQVLAYYKSHNYSVIDKYRNTIVLKQGK